MSTKHTLKQTAYFGLLGLSMLVFCQTSNAARINEIRIDQSSTDNDEYFELAGDPFESLAGLTYLVVGDGAGGSGVIEAAIDLNAETLDANGLFTAAESTFTLVTADLTTTLNFENSDNVTHLLVSGFVGAVNDDLDTDDDGIIDNVLYSSIVDSIGLQESVGTGELLYSDTVIGPDGTFVPGHVYYCPAGWQIGLFAPLGDTDTPSAENDCSAAGPVVRINEIRIDQSSTDNDEYFELSGLPSASLDGLSYVVIGDGGGASGTIEAIVDLTGQSLDANGLFTAAESTFTLAAADLTTTLNFENSDNVTHLLVSGLTGVLGDDLDTDDDGSIDFAPYDEIVDSIALKENDTGELLYSDTIVGPDGTFVPGHVYLCDDGWQIGTFDPLGETDTPTAENDCDGIVDPGVTERTIPEIQSDQSSSPFVGDTVKTTGVVVADFQGNDELKGFFLQDETGDANIATSDGIFVYDPDGIDVSVGDVIEIVAEVDEFFDLTELKNVTSITVTGTSSVTPTPIVLPETFDGELEQYEGMLVTIASDMTVAQNFFLGRYGQLTLSSPDDDNVAGRLYKPTNIFAAGTTENADLVASNARRILILDDGQDVSSLGDNPDPVPYIGNPPTVLRAGDGVSNLVGVLDYGRINSASIAGRDYRLHPTSEPIFTPLNFREAIPQSTNGTLSIASFNVLNYFTTLDGNGDICGPLADQGCRGADSASELQRQQDKIVSALFSMNADVVGLIEIENNGYGTDSAIATLVEALNAEYATTEYAYVTPDGLSELGSDVIAVGFIYKPANVSPVGIATTLTTGAFDQTLESGRSRAPLAVSFEELASGEQFTAVVNHFKSKNPSSDVLGDGNDDQGDGQGAWNLRRTEAAADLANWMATFPTGIEDQDILILGDLNAYAEEDPMLELEAQGYTDLIQQFTGNTGYSFIFDGESGSLDHALATTTLADQVTGVVEWHINTDEPAVISYDENFNPDGYYSLDPFRSSDHDPVIVGLMLSSEPEDADQDGVADDDDLCPGTLEGSVINSDGCSGAQIVVLECGDGPAAGKNAGWRYLSCVFNSLVESIQAGLLTRQEARKIYWQAIIAVFFHH
ncbi:MAG: ExeM/NucH family extracellular endonuclease [Acidiferrobacterales bacterium]|nr:ExeM/NucH family extracellular endonuclease [Acidiferrobacterales bacterium]